LLCLESPGKEADNPNGCQVKPGGMLCFTGSKAFMRWADIFGSTWADAQRAANLGQAAKDIHFDARTYWKFNGHEWVTASRPDAILELKSRGISDRRARNATMSDAEKVLHYIQNNNRVVGAVPLVGPQARCCAPQWGRIT
jgi:hypothetical protein